MFKKSFYILTVMVLLLGIFVGVAYSEKKSVGNTLNISWPETFRSVDPHQHDNQRVFWAIIGQGIFDHLVERNSDGELVSGLATSWENVEPTVWEFKLRKGVKFHNGEPFNAEAVKYTFKRLVEKNAPCLFLFSNIEEVEVIDDYTVRIHTTGPAGSLPLTLTLAEIVPPKAGEKEEFSTHPVGTGPFKFEEWIKGEKFSMVANKDYWGRVPKLERVIHYPILEAATRVAGFKTGSVDIIHHVPQTDVASLKSLSDLKIVSIPGNDTVNLVFDHDKEFGDVRVRRAIGHAIDKKEIEEYILEEVGTGAKSYLAPSVFGFEDVTKYLPEYDLDKARKLLEEAGYSNGFSTEIVAPAGFYPKDREILEYMKANLSQVGIDLKLRLLEPAAAWPILDSEDFDLFIAGWAAMTMDADFGLYRNYHSANTREGFVNVQVDKMLDKGKESADPEVRKDAYSKAQIEIAKELLRYPIYHVNIIYGIRNRVKGFKPRSDEIYDLTTVSIEE